MYNSLVFSVFIESCNHGHYTILEHFSPPQKESCLISKVHCPGIQTENYLMGPISKE